MRLQRTAKGGTLKQRLVFSMIRLTSGHPAPDVVRTLMHRPEYFGSHMSRLTQAVMRGPSEWTVGERELVAAFVSRLNQCLF